MIYIQLIGLLAFCIHVLSFYKKKPITILVYQITANFAYAVHYFLLGGISGAILDIISIFRNITFIRIKDNKVIASLIFIFLYLLITFLFYEDYYSIFPFFGNTVYLLSIIRKDRKSLLIGGILCSIFWLLYAIFVNSYVSIVTEIILILSNSIQLVKYKRVVSVKK